MKYRVTVYLCIIAIAVITAYCSATPAPVPPEAERGILDLRNWNLLTQGTIELKGNWEFYWNQLLTADNFNSETPPVKTGFIYVPDSWDTLTVHGNPLSNKGYGTYRLTVKTSGTAPLLGMRIIQVFQASKIWVNGDLLCSTGTIGTSPATMRPERSTRIVYFQPHDHLMEIIIQIHLL